MTPQPTINYQVQVIELQPEDKILVLFNPEWMDVDQAHKMYKILLEDFPNRRLIGLYGTDIKIIREEDENAEDNFKKHLAALYKDTQA